MEGAANTEGPENDQTLNIDSFIEYIMAIQELSITDPQIQGDQELQKETRMESGENNLISNTETNATQHSELVSSPINTPKIEDIDNKDNHGFGKRHDKLFTCHTHSMDRVYCTWLGTNYWYMYAKPYWDTKLPSEEQFFDDRLNYLECSDVMTDYANGMWEQALLDSDPGSLLESDQYDETKQSQDYLNGCDLALSGVTCLNEVSDNSVDEEDSFTGLAVSPPQPTEVAVRKELSRDRLEALQPEMVITVGHQEDETSSVKSKERCKLPFSAVAIQNDQAGIEEENKENSLVGELSIHGKQLLGTTSVEHPSANSIDTLANIKCLNSQTGEQMENSLILTSPSTDTEREKQSPEDKMVVPLGENCPTKSSEMESNQQFSGIGLTDINGTVPSQSREKTKGQNCKKTAEAVSYLVEQQVAKCHCNMECPARRNAKENPALTVTNGNESYNFLPESSSQSSQGHRTSTEVSGRDANGLHKIHSDCPCHRSNVMPKDISLTLFKENTHFTQPFDNKDILGESASSTCSTVVPKPLGTIQKVSNLTKAVSVKGSLDCKHENVGDTLAMIDRNTDQGLNPCPENKGYGGMTSRRATDQLKMNLITKKANSITTQQKDTIPEGKRRPSKKDGIFGSNRELLNGGVVCKATVGKGAAPTMKSKVEARGSSGGTVPKDSDEEDDNAGYIPNSQELLFISEDSDVYETGKLDTKRDSSQKPQCPNSLANALPKPSSSQTPVASIGLLETKAEKKMAKRTISAQGKESDSHPKIHNKQTLGGKEGLAGDKDKLVKKEDKMETSSASSGKDKDGKAPRLLHKIQVEMFADYSGNVKLFCQFRDIHGDSTITWTKDSKLLARMHRSSSDESPVSLAIVQMSKKDQGIYLCTLKNSYGKASSEFHLTSDVLEQLSPCPEAEGGEEIEFNQLLFREDFITDMYFGGNLYGRITTEDLHFGEGVHRKAFRSKVMCGLFPVFNPGHLCVLKVHNAIAYGTKNNDELVQRNYKLAVQECHVQNTAREYAKIYAAEAEQLEDFGKVPEIIPIFLIHRPANNIPYATVEEELIGDFVKYSVKDGKEINVLRKDSEAGQKCCTFQHWVYEKTNGNLLVTDMQGVGMKLTDVGIATITKGYKGFKGNCSVSFIDQFKALHQCNKFCEILGLKSLKANPAKPKKQSAAKERTQPSAAGSRKSKNGPKPKHKT
eukprot:XP_012822939.1 PREDICTED: alpha-protein kinase 2 [Xenopus tropicalis]